MKSEPATPLMRDCSPFSPGVAVSAAATCALGGSADGTCGAALCPAPAGSWDNAGLIAVAAPAATTPVRKLRRSFFQAEYLRAIVTSSRPRNPAAAKLQHQWPRFVLER